jgi:hypothetical protein
MGTENNTTSSSNSNSNSPSKLRFIDLLFIVYYAVAFVCFLLNFIGVTNFYETYFNATWFVFPFIIQLLATRLITLKEIIFSKFPLSFKPLLRNLLIFQFIIQHLMVLVLVEYPSYGAQINSLKTQFLICNTALIIWSLFAIYQKITTKKPAKADDKKK